MLHAGELRTLPCTGTRAIWAPVIKQSHPKQTFLLNNPTYQAFARWNSLKPEVRWTAGKVPFKKLILKKLVTYLYQRWRNDHSHLLYEGVDVSV